MESQHFLISIVHPNNNPRPPPAYRTFQNASSQNKPSRQRNVTGWSVICEENCLTRTCGYLRAIRWCRLTLVILFLLNTAALATYLYLYINFVSMILILTFFIIFVGSLSMGLEKLDIKFCGVDLLDIIIVSIFSVVTYWSHGETKTLILLAFLFIFCVLQYLKHRDVIRNGNWLTEED